MGSYHKICPTTMLKKILALPWERFSIVNTQKLYQRHTQPNKRWAKSRMNLIIIRVCLSLSSEKGRVYVTRWAFGCCWEEEEGGNGWLLRGHQDCIKCMHATVVMFGCAYHQVLQVILWSLGCEMWLGWSTQDQRDQGKATFF